MADEQLEGMMQSFQAKIKQKLHEIEREVIEGFEHLRSLRRDELRPSDDVDIMSIAARFRDSYTQVELLNLLVEVTGGLVPRALLLIRKGPNTHGWAGAGFTSEFMDKGLKRVRWSIDDYPELTRVIEQKRILSTNFSDLSDISEAIAAFDGFVPIKSCFLPLNVKNKVAALLYVDSGSNSSLENLHLIELFCYIAGLELSLVTSKIKVAETAAETAEAEAEAVPVQAEPPPAKAASRPAPTEAPKRKEPPKVIPMGPVKADTAVAKARPKSDEDSGVAKAKRVARVLVSDLKLYNEAAVEAGRKNGDLYDRLKDDLERSHKHYQERVAGLLTSPEANYFKEELIKQLGEGDPDVLGPIPF